MLPEGRGAVFVVTFALASCCPTIFSACVFTLWQKGLGMSSRDDAIAVLRGQPKDDYVPAIAYRIERKKSTGTKELATIAKALDSIHDTLTEFVETIFRTDEKNSQISQRLYELKIAIQDNVDPSALRSYEQILEDLDARIFEEKLFTEKCGSGAMRMTTSTKLSHLDKLASTAAKIAAGKQKMSDGEYLPTHLVIDNAQRTLSEAHKFATDILGAGVAEERVADFMKTIIKIWDNIK